MLDYLGAIASILGFFIALITLMAALNIRGKIDRSLGKQRFLQQKEHVLAQLTDIRARILNNDESVSLENLLLHLRELMLQLTNYRIWRATDKLKFKRYIGYLSKAYNGAKPRSRKELVMRIDEVVAMVKAQLEV